jgi:hypothetical protein
MLASILHALTNGLRGLLDSMAAKPYPRPRIALSEYDCQKDTNRSAVLNSERMHPSMAIQSPAKPPEERYG